MAEIAARPPAGRGPRGSSTLPGLVDAVKALAHPGRLRILAMLQQGDLCVCQMTAVLELAASTVSAHLASLRHAGLVTERKDGKWVHYHLVATGPLADLVRRALRLAGDDDRLDQDARVAGRLRRIPLETFCTAAPVRTAPGLVPRPSAAEGRVRKVRRPRASSGRRAR